MRPDLDSQASHQSGQRPHFGQARGVPRRRRTIMQVGFESRIQRYRPQAMLRQQGLNPRCLALEVVHQRRRRNKTPVFDHNQIYFVKPQRPETGERVIEIVFPGGS